MAIPVLTMTDQLVWLTVYQGDVGVNPLIFNTSRARERIQRLRDGEIVASKTHMLMNLTRREATVEYNHLGAKASDIASLLEDLARSQPQFDTLELSLNPVVDEEFIRAIDRFGRIRVASIRVARPNPDWSDHYNNFTSLAADSDAGAIDVTLTASRRHSLSKTRGLIRHIKDLVTGQVSILKSARVAGEREGETEETAISLSHHIEHQKIAVKRTDDGHVDSRDIRDKMEEYLNARARRRRS